MKALIVEPPRTSSFKLVPAFFLYGEDVSALDEAAIHVETIEARSRPCGWNIRPHRHHDLYQILVLQVGAVTTMIDEHFVVLPAPALVIIPPGIVHSFRFETETSGMVASFDGGVARMLATGNLALNDFLNDPFAESIATGGPAMADLSHLCTMLLAEFTRAAAGRECALRGLLGALTVNAYRLSRASHGLTSHVTGRQHLIVEQFREVIERDFHRSWSVPRYGRAIGVSETQLRRACQAVTGQSPAALIQSRLVIEAKRQLRYTAAPVVQVAHYLGFDDPAYFARFFKRATGFTPTKFRDRGSPAASPSSEP